MSFINTTSVEDFQEPETLDHYSFETIDPVQWHTFFADKRSMVYYAGTAYVASIFTLQKWMRNRKAFDLKMPLFWWNLGLGIFSICGFARMAPGFLSVLQGRDGIYQSICVRHDKSMQTGYWTIAFILSKWVELGDTLFIILRKRPLVLLQWYHHLATMVCSWVFAPYMEPIGYWYAVINYGVHSLMYPYFALRAVGIVVPAIAANLITTLQLVQMVVGVTINVLSIYYPRMGQPCLRYPASIFASLVVYSSFLVLFGKLFYDLVVRRGRQQKDRLCKKLK